MLPNVDSVVRWMEEGAGACEGWGMGLMGRHRAGAAGLRLVRTRQARGNWGRWSAGHLDGTVRLRRPEGGPCPFAGRDGGEKQLGPWTPGQIWAWKPEGDSGTRWESGGRKGTT